MYLYFTKCEPLTIEMEFFSNILTLLYVFNASFIRSSTSLLDSLFGMWVVKIRYFVNGVMILIVKQHVKNQNNARHFSFINNSNPADPQFMAPLLSKHSGLDIRGR